MCILIVLAYIHKLFINQMDVKISFLNGDLEEKIYMYNLKVALHLNKKIKFAN